MSCERVSERASAWAEVSSIVVAACSRHRQHFSISIRKGCSAPSGRSVYFYFHRERTRTFQLVRFSSAPSSQHVFVSHTLYYIRARAERVIIIIRHILRINSLSRLLLFIYLFWSAYPASHKVTHECITLVILAVALVMTVIMRAGINIVRRRQIARLSEQHAR